MAYKRILVCLDGSALAETALPHTQTLVSAEEAEIMLLRVSTNPAAEFSFSDPRIAHTLIEEREAEPLTHTQSARGKLQKVGFRTSFLIRQGAEIILRVATECSADVIVMPTQERSGIKRRLLASVADRVRMNSSLLFAV